MTGKVTMTLEERQARYERMRISKLSGLTLEVIGAAEDPPLSKERVRTILANPPRPVGRPKGGPTHDD